MTPLIRETIAWTTTTGMDPTELQWFDISGLTADQVAVNTDALMTCRPPFGRCFVASRGPSKSHASYDVLAVVVGDDPHEGIVIDMWKGPTNVMPRKIPTMLYTIEGGKRDRAAIEDAVGDVLVCLINYCALRDLDITRCLAGAYEQIKDRRGTLMPDGTFVKEQA